MSQWKCYLCSKIQEIPYDCLHYDAAGREFFVKMKEIGIKPTKPKENGYLYKPPCEK